ncbi:HXXEE domain-containing protein [Metabacillus litoralis]|uniref:HXXEE domain-containing protein n=1 Tax=Metabacillus litoralis TaxID=152268 RepID=UPI002040038A|nr:HXXEE domain-containing protein [Metabacillus litoralis]MCM3409664.1 HXXEE domain-containing protein [Metabacillus litoralis]
MMFSLEIHNAIWLFLVIFMLHDFEEIISVESWSKKTSNLVESNDSRLKKLIWSFWNINSHSFAKRDVVIFLVASTIVFIKVQFIESEWVAILFMIFLCFVLLHNLVHIIQTLILKTYTPGLYTAIGLVTPYTIYLFYRLV